MTDINPTELDAEECQRLIAELASTIQPGQSLMGDRILALVPKKGPWPVRQVWVGGDEGDQRWIFDWESEWALTIRDECGGLLIHLTHEEGDLLPAMMSDDNWRQRNDAAAVKWLAHRGVDLAFAAACIRKVELEAGGDATMPEYRALRAVLDNAKGAE